MDMVYIQFETPKNVAKIETKGYFKRATRKIAKYILEKIFPLANPDVEDKIGLVTDWYVECDKHTGVPQREAGLNDTGELILKLPDENNIGFWTDSNMLLDDFIQHFNARLIPGAAFEEVWTRFDKLSDFEIELDNFTIVSTARGEYITADIDYNGTARKLVVFFMDGVKLEGLQKIKVAGMLNDAGPSESLHLNRAWIVD